MNDFDLALSVLLEHYCPVEFARKPLQGQKSFEFDEGSHPRETDSHDGKRPGEFAPKSSHNTNSVETQFPSLAGHVEFAPEFIPHKWSKRGNHVTVYADAKKLDAALSRYPSSYIPAGGGGAEISGRTERFNEFLNSGMPIEQPYAGVNDAGDIMLEDGRHRTRVLMDRGVPIIPLTVHQKEAGRVQKSVGVENKSENSGGESDMSGDTVGVENVPGKRLSHGKERSTVTLTAQQISSAKSAIQSLAPWTRRANLRWSFSAGIVKKPGTDLTGTTTVYVTVGDHSWAIRKFGTSGQYAMDW